MYAVIKSEEELFHDIECFSELSIAITRALSSLARLRSRIMSLSDGRSEDLQPLCHDFEGYVAAVKGMRDEIGQCDPYLFPALAFMEFSQALYYVLRRVRKLLPPMYHDDPIIGVCDKLEEVKNFCRPERRPEEITTEHFRDGVSLAFAGMINHSLRIAAAIRSYDAERKIDRPPTPTVAALSRIEVTAEDTSEIVRRLDNRDRRQRKEAGKGPLVGLSAQKRVYDAWLECQRHPEWFGDASARRRVSKSMAYERLSKSGRLPRQVDGFKAFCRIIDSARKRMD